MSIQTPNRVHAALSTQIHLDVPSGVIDLTIVSSVNVRSEQMAQVVIDELAMWVPMVRPILPAEAVITANAQVGPAAAYVSPLPSPFQAAYDALPDSALVWQNDLNVNDGHISVTVFQVTSEPGPIVPNPD